MKLDSQVLLEPSYGKKWMNLLANPIFMMLCIVDVLTLLSLHRDFLCPWLPFHPKVYFVGHKYNYTCFFWLLFAWNIIFGPFILSLCVSLELKQVSWRHHTVQSYFLIYPTTLCLLIDEFSLFTFQMIVDI